MKATSFLYRHYLVDGESLTTHAAAVMIGSVMIVAGVVLVSTVALMPVGVVVGVLGLFILGGGTFAHIQRPVKFRDLVDAVVSLAGAAISITFTLAVLLFVGALGVSAISLIAEWLRTVL